LPHFIGYNISCWNRIIHQTENKIEKWFLHANAAILWRSKYVKWQLCSHAITLSMVILIDSAIIPPVNQAASNAKSTNGEASKHKQSS